MSIDSSMASSATSTPRTGNLSADHPLRTRIADAVHAVRSTTPLAQSFTNFVTINLVANAQLAAGGTAAMSYLPDDVLDIAAICGATYINVGTLLPFYKDALADIARGLHDQGKPWVLDPVAAGGIPWRDDVIRSFVEKRPTVIRGNASEIRALAGFSSAGKGVDSCDSSDSALEAAELLARTVPTVVHVTGETDYVTDGKRTMSVAGGHEMTTLVVGTGCSLSALVAAFAAVTEDRVAAAAAAAMLAKRAAEYAAQHAKAPGSFHVHYIDGLYLTGRTE